jgi:hypothetical protein
MRAARQLWPVPSSLYLLQAIEEMMTRVSSVLQARFC